jgi:hypothetical protein
VHPARSTIQGLGVGVSLLAAATAVSLLGAPRLDFQEWPLTPLPSPFSTLEVQGGDRGPSSSASQPQADGAAGAAASSKPAGVALPGLRRTPSSPGGRPEGTPSPGTPGEPAPAPGRPVVPVTAPGKAPTQALPGRPRPPGGGSADAGSGHKKPPARGGKADKPSKGPRKPDGSKEKGEQHGQGGKHAQHAQHGGREQNGQSGKVKPERGGKLKTRRGDKKDSSER